MSLIDSYFKLTKQYISEYGQKTIVLTQNGAFFEVYGLKDTDDSYIGSQIEDFSTICDLNIVDKKTPAGNMTINGKHVVNAGFKNHLLEKYLKKLQDHGYTIVVYEETGEDVVNDSKLRTKTGIYSPGTYFGTQDKLTNNICCIWMETRTGVLKSDKYKHIIDIGVGIVDILTGFTCVNEINEEYMKNPITFDSVERLMSIYNPSEVIIITNIDKNELDDVVSYMNLNCRKLHIHHKSDKNESIVNCEKQKYQLAVLMKYYKIKDDNLFMSMFYERVFACQAFCYLLDFIYQHNPFLTDKLTEPIFENTNGKLKLANHSLKQLNIINTDHDNKCSSVLNLLNECITPMGKRKFAYNLVNPISNIDILTESYDITDKLLSHPQYAKLYSTVKSILSKMKDIDKINRSMCISKSTPKQLYQLYQSLTLTAELMNILSETTTDSLDLTNYRTKEIVSRYTELLKKYFNFSCFDEDDIEAKLINSGVNEQLDNYICRTSDSKDKLECCMNYLNDIISKFEKKNKSKTYISIHETEKNNHSLVTTDRRSKIIQNALKNTPNVELSYTSTYSHNINTFQFNLNITYSKQGKGTDASKVTVSSPQIDEFCKDVSRSKTELIDLFDNIFKQIVINLCEHSSMLDEIVHFITYIDTTFCKANIAHKYKYCKPTIVSSENSFVSVKELRHCLIEHIQQNELYVSNDIFTIWNKCSW